jgi:hypothetical protein
VIEDNEFLVGGTTGVFVGTSPVPGARFTIRGNRFEGGLTGVFAAGATPWIEVLDNVFQDHPGWGAVQFQGGARGRIAGNTFSGCGFQGCIRAIQTPAAEVEENSISQAYSGAELNFAILAFAASPGASVTIRGNRVEGTGIVGPQHVFAEGIVATGGTATVAENFVTGARRGIVRNDAQGGAVRDNEVSPCGQNCITITNTVGQTVVRGNRLVAIRERGTIIGILANAAAGSGTVTIVENQVHGLEPPTNPADPSTFPLVAGIQAGAWPPGGSGAPGAWVTVLNNHVRHATAALVAAHGGRLQGADNRVEDSHLGISARDHGVNTITRSDFERVHVSLSGDGTLAVPCNWWGSAAGPTATTAAPASAYSPWATQPIAGRPAVACP